MTRLVFCLPLLLLSSGCSRTTPAASPAKGEGTNAEALKVRLVKPKAREIEHPGRIKAFLETPVHVRVPGYVKEIKVDIGDVVRGPCPCEKSPGPDEPETDENAGQVLARLAVPELEEEVELKRRLIVSARAEIKQAEEAYNAAAARVTEVMAGEKRVEADLNRWQAQLTRLNNDKTKDTLAKQELEEVGFQVEAAKAAKAEQKAKVAAADAALKKYQADIGAAEAKCGAAESECRKAVDMLRYAVIRAPFDGVVTRRLADPGHYRHPGAAGPRGEALLIITSTNPVRVIVEVPEADAVRIPAKAEVRVRVPALKDVRPIKGVVTRTSWALDARSRTMEVAIDLPNDDGRLRPEMYAVAAITLDNPRDLRLPVSAVYGAGNEAFAFRIVDGKAVRTPIRVGPTSEGLIAVLQKQPKPDAWDDVTEEDEFVADNAATLADGAKVVVEGK